MKSFYFSIVKYVYATVFAVVIGILFLFWNDSYVCKQNFLLSNSFIFCVVFALLIVSACFYVFLNNKRTALYKVYEIINIDKILKIATLVLFLIQCYMFYNVYFLSGWDTWHIRVFVDALIKGTQSENILKYYSMYPNNLFISYFYSFLIKINKAFGLFPSEYSYMCVVILNCAINSLSCFLSYKTAKVFTSTLFSFIAYVFCVCSVGISGWSIICYSDSLALFIPILCTYLYCRNYKNKKTKALGISCSVIVSAIGYFIKPQCLLLFLAIVVLEIIKLLSAFSVKALIRFISLCLIGVTVLSTFNVGLEYLNKKNNIQLDEEKTFGFSHFLMMGANPDRNGVYSKDDVLLSDSYETKEERVKGNIEVFKQRIIGMKSNILTHLKNKVLITFNDGTFTWGYEGGNSGFFYIVPKNINTKLAPFLKSIYCNGERFVYFGTFLQFVWLLIFTASIFSILVKSKKIKQHNLMLLWIVLLGFFLYEMLFEVRARYLYIFVPIICTLAAVGIKNICVFAEELVVFVKNKKEGKFAK